MDLPTWYSRLPIHKTGKRTLLVDNNVLSNFMFEEPTNTVRFLFENNDIVIQAGRQVIDEALNQPTLSVQKRSAAWQDLGKLQEKGKLVLSGLSHMTPLMREKYNGLAPLLTAALVSHEDALVFADAIVKEIPIFTMDAKAQNALTAALRNANVKAFLATHKLPATAEGILLKDSLG